MTAVALATIRQDVFTALRALLIANKPTYTYNSATQTYTILAEYPRDNPALPCVVINKSNISVSTITLDGQTQEDVISAQLDFYAKELHGKKAIDAGQDGAMNTFIGNISAFIGTNGIVPTEDFWDDSNTTVFEDMNQVLNTASSIVKFKLR